MKRTLVVVGLVVGMALSCGARELVVSSTADSGQGTLRWALQSARTGDTITFDLMVFPPDDPATIYLQSELPPISRPLSHLTIDASDAGVILDGESVPGDWSNGLQIYTDDCVVMGLQIRNFTGSGITACGASRNTIGGDRACGAGPIGQGNLVTDTSFGINLANGAAGNIIAGNVVGTDTSYQVARGNLWGIYFYGDVTGTTIGPGNVVAYNQVDIALVGPHVVGTRITRNVYLRNAPTRIALQAGANGALLAPFVDSIDQQAGYVSGTIGVGCAVEIYTFLDSGQSMFEGTAEADVSGRFVFRKGSPLEGGTAVAVATDEDGNASPLSNLFPLGAEARLQGTSSAPPRRLHTYPSRELEDSRIALFTCALLHPEYEPEVFPDFGVLDARHILDLGVKRIRLAISNLDPPKIDWSVSEFEIEPENDAFIDELIGNGISVTFNLNFWDKDHAASGGRVEYPRFQSSAEVQRYLDYVRFIVGHFKGRVDHYELWNEPTNRDSIVWIKAGDYLELARKAVAVIREEDPEAKVIMGGVAFLVHEEVQDYLFEILRSEEVMPLVDVISWHPMYGTSPAFDYHRQYYYDYPALVREIKRIAAAHGFDGEFEGDELSWTTPEQRNATQPWPNEYSEAQCAKYYARGIVLHLGLVDSTSVILLKDRPLVYGAIQNLCTVMAGNESIDMPVQIDIDHEGPVAYCSFRYPNGDRMLAVWTDGVAVDEDPGVPATIAFPSLAASSVTGIDVLHGFEQQLTFEVDGEDTIVRDLLVKDYPILLRLSDATFGSDYEEADGDGFHRLGDIDAAGGGPDRDGDGIPDDDDWCPDYPGTELMHGC